MIFANTRFRWWIWVFYRVPRLSWGWYEPFCIPRSWRRGLAARGWAGACWVVVPEESDWLTTPACQTCRSHRPSHSASLAGEPHWRAFSISVKTALNRRTCITWRNQESTTEPRRRKQETTASLAAAEEISMGTAEAAVLSQVDSIFTLKGEPKKRLWRFFLVDNFVSLESGLALARV